MRLIEIGAQDRSGGGYVETCVIQQSAARLGDVPVRDLRNDRQPTGVDLHRSEILGTIGIAIDRADPTALHNGERGFRLDPELDLGLERVRRCEPRLLVFLERRENSTFSLTSMSPDEAAARLEEDLVEESPDAAARQMDVLRRLVDLPCRLLHYGGWPRDVAKKLAIHFGRL